MAAGPAAGTVSPDYPQSGFHHAVSATERPPVKRRCQKTADGARLRSDQTGGQDPMGRDPRAGRCLDSSHRDIAVIKVFPCMRAPKRSLYRTSADFSLCKVVYHVTYYWKLQHILRRLPLLISMYRHHEFHAVAKYPICRRVKEGPL